MKKKNILLMVAFLIAMFPMVADARTRSDDDSDYYAVCKYQYEYGDEDYKSVACIKDNEDSDFYCWLYKTKNYYDNGLFGGANLNGNDEEFTNNDTVNPQFASVHNCPSFVVYSDNVTFMNIGATELQGFYNQSWGDSKIEDNSDSWWLWDWSQGGAAMFTLRTQVINGEYSDYADLEAVKEKEKEDQGIINEAINNRDNQNHLIEENIGENFCDEENVINALRVVGYLLLVIKIGFPLLIIAFGTFDVFKIVMGGDEKATKAALTQLGSRILLGLIIFLFPTLLHVLLSFIGEYTAILDDVKKCETCLLSPSNCENGTVEVDDAPFDGDIFE